MPAVGIVALLVPWLWFDVLLIDDPDTAPIDKGDIHLYRLDPSAGYAYQETAEAILARYDGETEFVTLISGGCCFWQTSIYLGDIGEHLRFNQHAFVGVTYAMADGRDVYIVLVNGAQPQDWLGLTPTYIDTFQYESVTIDLYQATRTSGDLAEAVLDRMMPEPAQIEEPLAMASQTIRESGSMDLLVWPAMYLSDFDGAAAHVQSLEAREWPPSQSGIEDELSIWVDAMPDTAAERVTLVRVDPLTSDPDQVLPDMLGEQLYYTGENWFDFVQARQYVTGPDTPVYETVDAEWEETIHLDETAIVDGEVSAGEWLRMAFQWSTTDTIGDSFAVFVHLVDESGTLWAQYDGIPDGGLRPMTDWVPGETIEDRFAFRLPPDLPSGRYILRTGIYLPESQLRLRVTQGEGGGDFVVIGAVEVR